MILCYVGVLIMFRMRNVTYRRRKLRTKREVQIKDLRKPKRLLGIDFKSAQDGSLKMTQAQHIEKLMRDTGMFEKMRTAARLMYHRQ